MRFFSTLALGLALLAPSVTSSLIKNRAEPIDKRLLSINITIDLPFELTPTSNTNCVRQSFNVASVANRTVFDLNKMGVRPSVNQSRITELIVQFTTDPAGFNSKYVTGTNPVTQNFTISGVLCTPKTGANSSSALQVLMHGIGFDSNYWNFQGSGVAESQYSYVWQAAARGVSTFRFDRLGTGQSAQPSDGFNVVQGPVDLSILLKFLDVIKHTNYIGGRTWAKTLLVGHSYGSILAEAAAVARPDLLDGLILTGFSSAAPGVFNYFQSEVFTQVNQVKPSLFPSTSNDYVIGATQYADQTGFYYQPYTPPANAVLARNMAQPVTMGVLFTAPFLPGVSTFTGPVHVVLPARDFIFVLNNPSPTALAQATADNLFPQASVRTSFVPQNFGHTIQVHQNANAQVATEMLDFAAANGL